MAENVVETIRKYTEQVNNAPAPKGVNPQDWQSAQSQVAAQYGPQEANLYDTYDEIQSTLNRDVATQQTYGQIADQKMATIGQQLNSQLQQGVETTGQTYAAGQAKVGSLYDDLLSTLGTAGDEVKNALGSEAARLGQDPNSQLGRITGELAVLKGRAATAKAGAVSNLVTLGAQMQSIAEQRRSGAQQEYAGKRADLAKQIQFSITQLQHQAQTNSTKVFKQLNALAKSKGAALSNALQQAATARTKAERQAAKDAADLAYKEATLTMKLQEMMMKNDPDSLDNQLKSARLTRVQQLTAKGGKSGSFSPTEMQGQYGLDLWGEEVGLGEETHSAINNFIRGVEGEAAEMEDQPYGYGINLIQQYMGLTKDKDKQKFIKSHPALSALVSTNTDSNDAITALQIYFGRYGGRTNMVIP